MQGMSKLLRDFRGESVIRTVVRTATRSGLAPIVVVSAGGAELGDHLRDLPVEIRITDPGREDRLASVMCGLGSPRLADTEAVVILLGDEPEVDDTDISAVRGRWLTGGTDLLRARYVDRPGHPVILSAALVTRLLTDPPTGGDPDHVWECLTEQGRSPLEVSIRRPSPIDVDTLADLERARGRRRAP
jgi:molybdenum cofactor cytidylyltransferase